jgi:hypothetical protein
LPRGLAAPCPQVTQGVYTLLLRNGLHYKPTEEEVAHILTTATSNDASQADVDLSKENIHACVRVLSFTSACLPELSVASQVVKDCENLRSSLKRHLRSAENLPALWHKKGGLPVGGTGEQLPSFPGEADVELQVVVLRCLYQALPDHYRRVKNAKDANSAEWRTRVGLSSEGACCYLRFAFGHAS